LGSVNRDHWQLVFLERPDLATFIEDGPAPVYVGFGSMSFKDPAKTATIVLSANRLPGHHQRGMGLPSAIRTAPGVFAIDDVPHDWLFPRMASIVHHGGAGTTTAVLRAGRAPTADIPSCH
jgi:sterol 3beta-glucosyltransferase